MNWNSARLLLIVICFTWLPSTVVASYLSALLPEHLKPMRMELFRTVHRTGTSTE